MIEMSENYTPELSEYKEGRVVQLQVVHSTRTTCAPELSEYKERRVVQLQVVHSTRTTRRSYRSTRSWG